MPDAAAAEAAERKRVMHVVAHLLECGLSVTERVPESFATLVWQAITELRTPVGREKIDAARAAERRDQEEGR